MARKIFVIDVKKCNGCHTCQVACKDEHVGNDWTPIAKPQPETGQFWLKLEQEVRGTVPKVRVAYRPHLCMHCDEAPCMDACPVEGVIYKREDGLVIIDPGQVHGLQELRRSLPVQGDLLQRRPEHRAEVHGLCPPARRRLEGAPMCRRLSHQRHPLSRRRRGTGRLIAAVGEVWKPELKDRVKPRVYYLNLPGRFIAGCVYDPKEKEVIIGATCTLTEGDTGKVLNGSTDDFGDFWFEGLPEGEYGLEIRMDGKVKSFAGLDTKGKDINLGDIPLV